MELKKVSLGSSGLEVTEFCFGTLTISPLQADIDPVTGGALIRKAIEEGITFFDTAQGYKAYPHMREGLKGADRSKLVIATKSHARTEDEMQAAFDEACSAMQLEYIDIFHMHLIASVEDFEGRCGALRRLKELKSKGLVKAIGISAHTIAPFRHVINNFNIDVCYPAFNMGGYGINDGTVVEMATVLRELSDSGRGIYAMKPLGGGHLTQNYKKALDYVRQFPFMHAVSIGMKDESELALNLAYFRQEPVTDDMREKVQTVDRQLMINGLCKGCGRCIKVCEQGALSMGENKAEVDLGKCIFCGYCAPECPEFAIRII